MTTTISVDRLAANFEAQIAIVKARCKALSKHSARTRIHTRQVQTRATGHRDVARPPNVRWVCPWRQCGQPLLRNSLFGGLHGRSVTTSARALPNGFGLLLLQTLRYHRSAELSWAVVPSRRAGSQPWEWLWSQSGQMLELLGGVNPNDPQTSTMKFSTS